KRRGQTLRDILISRPARAPSPVILRRLRTDHDSKPLLPSSGIRLPTGWLLSRQEKHRNRRATAGALSRDMLGLPQTGAGLRSSSRAALRVHSSLGFSDLPALSDAARPVSHVRRGGGGGSLERRETSVDQSLHVVAGPLG